MGAGPDLSPAPLFICGYHMEYRLSRHAELEMEQRRIPLAAVEMVLRSPERRVPEGPNSGLWIYQSRMFANDKEYLLRIVVAEDRTPPLVITLYRTSKIELEPRMKIVYNPEVDILNVVFRDGQIAESDHDKPGLILDYDAAGNVVGLEILQASAKMANPMSVEYSITPPAAHLPTALQT